MKSYEKIYNLLKNRIISGRYKPDAPLPPERNLCGELGVSRITLRHAMRLLQQRGFVDSIQGDGTYVRSAAPEKIPVFNNDFVGSIIRGMPDFKRTLLKAEQISPPAYIVNLLQLQDNEKCLLAERLDVFENTPFSYDKSYIPEKLTSSINKKLLVKIDFYNAWLKAEGLKISRKTESIEAVRADKTAVERLECKLGSPLLMTTETMYDRENRPVSVFESYYRGDLIKLSSRREGYPDEQSAD